MSRDSVRNSPKVKIQGKLLRDALSQNGAAVSKGIAGGWGAAEADCGRDCYTWCLVCESAGTRLPPHA